MTLEAESVHSVYNGPDSASTDTYFEGLASLGLGAHWIALRTAKTISPRTWLRLRRNHDHCIRVVHSDLLPALTAASASGKVTIESRFSRASSVARPYRRLNFFFPAPKQKSPAVGSGVETRASPHSCKTPCVSSGVFGFFGDFWIAKLPNGSISKATFQQGCPNKARELCFRWAMCWSQWSL